MVLLIAFSSLLALSTGCTESEYQKVVDEELAKGIRQDSLFLGLALGMSKKEFFAHCWQLNKQGVVTDGKGNTAVQYTLDHFKNPTFMNFYPAFYEDNIYEMPVEFQYQGWAPWNDHLSSEHLQEEVVKLLKEWYGGDFMELTHPDGYPFLVKVDGNRRIVVHQYNDHIVKAVFTDLLVEKRLHQDNPSTAQ
ncbi:MAG: hypothetical protein RIG62_00090 [Cyclobacteriaceae bacterium]